MWPLGDANMRNSINEILYITFKLKLIQNLLEFSLMIKLFNSTLSQQVIDTASVELVAVYRNAKHALELRRILCDLGFPQNSIIIQTDNICVQLFTNDLSKDKKLKHTDLRFNWLKYIRTKRNTGDTNSRIMHRLHQ